MAKYRQSLKMRRNTQVWQNVWEGEKHHRQQQPYKWPEIKSMSCSNIISLFVLLALTTKKKLNEASKIVRKWLCRRQCFSSSCFVLIRKLVCLSCVPVRNVRIHRCVDFGQSYRNVIYFFVSFVVVFSVLNHITANIIMNFVRERVLWCVNNCLT